MKDTIAAIATSTTSAGIGIIRISGPDAVSIGNSIFNGADLNLVASHTVHYGHIADGANVLDEVMVIVMREPRSYTTEDVVELQCHGGLFTLRKILSLVISKGARLAEPGEFTKRAFLNGRIDLSEAEAVMDLIASSNEISRKNSINQLSGKLKNEIQEIREDILYQCSYLESALDDPEHFDLTGYESVLSPVLDRCESRIERLVKSFDSGRIIKEGITTLIIGKPNAGKSSLLNTILDSDRAIVTDIPGTTRDVLEESAVFGGVTLKLVDTAGIRKTNDVVEKIGVDKAIDYVDNCDLILFVVDSSQELSDEDYEIYGKIKEKRVIIVLNKSDLNSMVDKVDIVDKWKKPLIVFSAKDGSGREELSSVISDMFFSGELSLDNDIMITKERHLSELKSALLSLGRVRETMELMMSEDLYTIDLMDAYAALGRIIGEAIEDDLADKIFKEFCMGK